MGLKYGVGKYSPGCVKFTKKTSASPYTFVKSITFDHTKVGTVNNTDQTNFPVLVFGTYGYLATVANGGGVQNTTTLNGQTVPADLVFATDNAAANLLNWEVASYNVTTGAIEVHIKIPTLSHTTNTTIYMHYGRPSITTYQGSATSVWDANFKMVSHYPNGTSLSALGSTNPAANGTIVGATATAGKIDGGANFVAASSQYIDYGTGLNIVSPLTISAWVNPVTLANNIVSQGYTFNNTQWQLTVAGTGKIGFSSFANGPTRGIAATTGTISSGVFSHVVGIYNGTAWFVYINGAQDATTVTDAGPVSVPGRKLEVGAVDVGGVPSTFFNGVIDEVRLSNIARSADWIVTEYNNQNSPSTFYTVV